MLQTQNAPDAGCRQKRLRQDAATRDGGKSPSASFHYAIPATPWRRLRYRARRISETCLGILWRRWNDLIICVDHRPRDTAYMEAVYREHPISQDLDRLTTLKELQELGHGKDRLLNA